MPFSWPCRKPAVQEPSGHLQLLVLSLCSLVLLTSCKLYAMRLLKPTPPTSFLPGSSLELQYPGSFLVIEFQALLLPFRGAPTIRRLIPGFAGRTTAATAAESFEAPRRCWVSGGVADACWSCTPPGTASNFKGPRRGWVRGGVPPFCWSCTPPGTAPWRRAASSGPGPC